MHSGRASARIGGLAIVGGLLLGVWVPRHGNEPLPMLGRLWATGALAVVAIWLVVSAVSIDRRAKRALKRRRSGDPSKR